MQSSAKMRRNKDTSGKSGWLSFFGALATAVILTVLLLAAEVFAIKTWMLSDRTIMILNYVVRVLALAGGSLVFSRSGYLKAWQRGVLLGGAYWLILYLVHFFTTSVQTDVRALILDAVLSIAIAFVFNVLFARR